MNTVPYTNAARAGRTHHGKIEEIKPQDPRYAIEHGRGYRTKRNHYSPNRADLRAHGIRGGFAKRSAYRRVRSLKALGLGPYAPKEATDGAD